MHTSVPTAEKVTERVTQLRRTLTRDNIERKRIANGESGQPMPKKHRRIIEDMLDQLDPPRGRKVRYLVVTDDSVNTTYPTEHPLMFDRLGEHGDPVSARGCVHHLDDADANIVPVWTRDVPPAFGRDGYTVIIAVTDPPRLSEKLRAAHSDA